MPLGVFYLNFELLPAGEVFIAADSADVVDDRVIAGIYLFSVVEVVVVCLVADARVHGVLGSRRISKYLVSFLPSDSHEASFTLFTDVVTLVLHDFGSLLKSEPDGLLERWRLGRLIVLHGILGFHPLLLLVQRHVLVADYIGQLREALALVGAELSCPVLALGALGSYLRPVVTSAHFQLSVRV